MLEVNYKTKILEVEVKNKEENIEENNVSCYYDISWDSPTGRKQGIPNLASHDKEIGK